MLAVNMRNAKRILLLVTQADWGGVQSFLVHFGRDLMAEGHTILLAAGGDGTLWKEARLAGIPAQQLRHMTRDISPLNDLRAVREITKLIDEFKPDAIHLNSSKMGVLGSIAASRSKTKPRVAYRIGGWSFLEPQPEWKKWIYQTAEKWSAPYKDVIITVHPEDEALAKQLNFAPRGEFKTVPNGIDLPNFISRLKTRSDARAALGIPEHAFVFGTIANAYPAKALLPYLDVLKRVCEKDRGISATIIGGGPEFDALKTKRDQLGLNDRIQLPGQLDNASTYLPAFDAFVLPSVKEGMPWSVLEALAAGIPCITTNVGACEWILKDSRDGDAGVTVPVGDASLLIDAMLVLKNDATRRERLSEAGRKTVSRRFTWSETYRGNRDALI